MRKLLEEHGMDNRIQTSCLFRSLESPFSQNVFFHRTRLCKDVPTKCIGDIKN